VNATAVVQNPGSSQQARAQAVQYFEQVGARIGLLARRGVAHMRAACVACPWECGGRVSPAEGRAQRTCAVSPPAPYAAEAGRDPLDRVRHGRAHWQGVCPGGPDQCLQPAPAPGERLGRQRAGNAAPPAARAPHAGPCGNARPAARALLPRAAPLRVAGRLMHAASCHVQVKHRWEELSEQEKQQVTQLAYQHLQDGEQRVPRGGGGGDRGRRGRGGARRGRLPDTPPAGVPVAVGRAWQDARSPPSERSCPARAVVAMP
jgi:hypothetical protein